MGFGVLCLGYGDFVSALQPVPASTPGYRALALLTGVFLVSTGLAVAMSYRVRAAGLGLVVLFASWIFLLHVPSAFLEPRLLRSPWWIRTFETLTFASAGLILVSLVSRPMRRDWIERARIAVGFSLPVFGTLHLIYPASVAALVPPWYPYPMFWAWFTGFAQIAAGLAITTRVLPRLAAALAGVMYGSWALTLHVPRSWCRVVGPCEFLPEVVGLQASRPGLTSLFVAIGMCGATWIVAGSLRLTYDEKATDPRSDGTRPSTVGVSSSALKRGFLQARAAWFIDRSHRFSSHGGFVMPRSSIVFTVLFAIVFVSGASAQQPRFDLPHPEHQLLERLAGEWHFERRSVVADGSSPQTLGSGVVTTEMVGSFFVVSRWSGTLYGARYEASQTLGYDIEKQQYTGHWTDSFMSFRWELSGSVDEGSQEFTLTTSGPAPTGGTTTFRERYELHSADSITIHGEMQRGGSWLPLSTTLLRREG
jgi:uncharacterized membrane protein